jgi:hypothetical protein
MSNVIWDIHPGVRAELHFFTGLSFSGQRSSCLIFHDQRRQGDDVDGSRVKSCGIIAHHGTRMTLLTSASATGWEDMAWRSIVVLPGTSFTSRSGKPAVQIPDLDSMDAFDANRTDLECQLGYPQVQKLAEGTGWTYGRSMPTLPLKCNIRVIRLDKV